MARERYQELLDELRYSTLAMGDEVVRRLEESLETIYGDNRSAARAIIDDGEINETYFRLESGIST